VDAIAFNWLIAGSDAHAKNYSILLAGGGQVRLAPLYDLASVLPYPKLDPHKVTLAMKLGGEYRLRLIGARQWHKLAAELRLDPARVRDRVRELAATIPDGAAAVRRRARESGLRHAVIERLADRLARRAAGCSKSL
jgi:serine/threonine-protein kinase HipA